MSHTPGPWVIALPEDVKSGEDMLLVSDTPGKRNGEHIACIYRSEPPGIDQANANLIAAAPELLAACQDIATAFDEEPITGDARLDGMIAKVKAAIAHAEGKV